MILLSLMNLFYLRIIIGLLDVISIMIDSISNIFKDIIILILIVAPSIAAILAQYEYMKMSLIVLIIYILSLISLLFWSEK